MKKMNHIDGYLYVGIAIAGCVLNHLSSKEAQELFSPAYIFFLKLYADVLGAGCLAAKTYRSTTFAEGRTSATVKESLTVQPQPNEEPK